MSSRESSRLAIATVARALGGERCHVVFVGGTIVALYPLEGVSDVRPTVDVDCVVDVTTVAEYYDFVDRLRMLGFEACTDEGAPLCRLVLRGTRVDVMGTTDSGIGPTNRWYRDAIAAPETYALAADLEVLAISPVYFVATKLQAFRSRGGGDYLESHDLEDVLTVLAGLPTLRADIASATSPIAAAMRGELMSLAAQEAFVEAAWGHFEGDAAGQARAALLISWLRALLSASPR